MAAVGLGDEEKDKREEGEGRELNHGGLSPCFLTAYGSARLTVHPELS